MRSIPRSSDEKTKAAAELISPGLHRGGIAVFHVVLVLGYPILLLTPLILLILFMVSISTTNEALREKIQKPLKVVVKVILILFLSLFVWTNVVGRLFEIMTP